MNDIDFVSKTPSAPRRHHGSFMPRFTSLQKKMLSSILGLSVLSVGLAVVTGIVLNTRSGDNRTKAAVDAQLYFGSTTVSVAANQNVSLDIFMNAGSNQVTAADLYVQLPNNVQFVSLVPAATPNLFDERATGTPVPTYALRNPIQLYPRTYVPAPTPTDAPYNSTTRVARLAIGVPVDRCYLGTAPNPNPPTGDSYTTQVPPCTTTPKAYPVGGGSDAATTTGKIATLTVRGLTAGNGTITIAAASQTAAIGTDTDVTSSRGTAAVTVTGTSTCVIDLNNDSSVSLADYGLFKTRYTAYLTSGAYNATIDFNNDNANSLADYGIFKTKYTQYLTSGACN